MRLEGWRRSLALTLAAVVVSSTAVFAGSLAMPDLFGEGARSALAASACSEAHIVQRGETLSMIARQYGASVSDLVKLNYLRDYDLIYIGQKLCLPTPGGGVPPQEPSGGAVTVQQPGGICVSGRKISDQHQGLGGFVVEAQMVGSTAVLHTVTDQHGYFQFSDLAPGLWSFSEIVPRGWEPVTASEFEIMLEYGRQGCYEIRFKNREVPIPACLIVAKADEADGSPLEGWEIQIKPSSGGAWQSGATDISGQVRFDGLEPGMWLVREVMQYPWQPTDPVAGESVVPLHPMEDPDDCYKLLFTNSRKPTGCIDGYKVDDDHRGMPGWTVCVDSSDPSEPIFCTTTIEGGYFRFDNLTLGEWIVWEELEPGWTPITAQKFTVTVDEVGKCTTVRFKNRAPDLCAEGYKLDDQGFGLGGWTIKAWPKSNPAAVLETVTEANGHYRVCGVTLGAWVFAEDRQVGWTALAGEQQELEIVFPGAGKDVQAPIFRNAPPRGCIEGWKVDDLEVGLPMWNITIQHVATGQTWHRWTDGTGYFQVCGLPMGTYVVWEEAQTGWKPVTPPRLEVSLEPSDEDVVAIVVFVNKQVERDMCIDGYKRDGFDGAGLPNWQVKLLDKAGNLIAVTTTDGTGYYRFSSLEAGTYVVEETVQDGWWSTSGASRVVTVTFPPRYECTSVNFTNVQRTGPGPCVTWHTVTTGETLARISLRYGVPMSAIMSANGLTNPNLIWISQRLCIPDP